MLATLERIFATNTIETASGESKPLTSHTKLDQGIFLQQVFEEVRPSRSIEIGMAYGISSLFILEKHHQYNSPARSHIIIEPFPWGGVAEYNIEKEQLTNYADIRYSTSDKVLPNLYYDGNKIQYAYIDTTKLFDTVLQDFYFLDKMMEVGGVMIFDDCGGGWPGIQKVVRFVNTLPHYKIYRSHSKSEASNKYKLIETMVSVLINLIPFKNKFLPGFSFKTDRQLGLNYNCIAFKKIDNDSRQWDWDMPL